MMSKTGTPDISLYPFEKLSLRSWLLRRFALSDNPALSICGSYMLENRPARFAGDLFELMLFSVVVLVFLSGILKSTGMSLFLTGSVIYLATIPLILVLAPLPSFALRSRLGNVPGNTPIPSTRAIFIALLKTQFASFILPVLITYVLVALLYFTNSGYSDSVGWTYMIVCVVCLMHLLSLAFLVFWSGWAGISFRPDLAQAITFLGTPAISFGLWSTGMAIFFLYPLALAGAVVLELGAVKRLRATREP